MPYRRLPNTDKARIRSLEKAVQTMRNSLYYRPVLPPELLSNAERVLVQFRELSNRYNKSLEEQIAFSKSDAYQNKLRNAIHTFWHFAVYSDKHQT